MESRDAAWLGLKKARVRLVSQLLSALEQSRSPQALLQALEGVYGQAMASFGHRQEPGRLVVALGAEPGQVVVRCEDGQVVLIKTPRGWSSHWTALRGRWLAALLASWPLFRVPRQRPGPLNAALQVLRDLLHDPDESRFEAIWEVIDGQIEPLVWAYVLEHVALWPESLWESFVAHRQRRFVEVGLGLLRRQLREGVSVVLERASQEHPHDGQWLEGALQAALDDACEQWNVVMNTSARFEVVNAEPGILHVYDGRDGDEVVLSWKRSRWLSSQWSFEDSDGQWCDGAGRIMEKLCQRTDPLWDEDWWEQELRIRQAEAFHAGVCYGEGYVDEDLEESADVPWEEDENWRLAYIYEGLQDDFERAQGPLEEPDVAHVPVEYGQWESSGEDWEEGEGEWRLLYARLPCRG